MQIAKDGPGVGDFDKAEVGVNSRTNTCDMKTERESTEGEKI